MFADEIRRAAEAAPCVKLPEVSALLWRAFAAGQVTETEAEVLSTLIEVRRTVPAAVAAPRKPVGSRPRTDASMERRRTWAASGRLPPNIACRFTLAEVAVLAVVAETVARMGDCRMPLDRIAALAGVCRTTAKNALKHARHHGLIEVEARKLRAWRNLSNVVRIISAEWQAWMRLARRPTAASQGGKSVPGTNTRITDSSNSGSSRSGRRASERGAGRRFGGHPGERFALAVDDESAKRIR